MPETHPERTFVPEDLDPAQWSQLEPLFQALLEQEIDSPADLRQWLADFSELMSVVSEFGTRRRVDQACHTDDPEIEKAFLHWVDEIAPKVKPLHFELQKKMLASPHKDALAKERFAILIREWQADVEIFRDENVPLQTQVTRKVSEYDKLIGAMEVEFRGETYTLQQMARFLDHPDRETREEAWRLSAERRLKDREAIDAIFDEVRGLRRQIAHNADLPDYRAYAWKAYGRFDYTPDDCIAFQDAVAEVCVPLVEALDRERRATLGLDALRPWDLAVDKKGRPPLRPFDADHPT
ncbi:MAG: M3 family metallopeptidase, partial [Phycisphaeraceae bacterium]